MRWLAAAVEAARLSHESFIATFGVKGHSYDETYGEGRYRCFPRFLHGITLRSNTMTGEAWGRAQQLPSAVMKLKGPSITAQRNGSNTDGWISQKAVNIGANRCRRQQRVSQ
jgi:hypothetical protein